MNLNRQYFWVLFFTSITFILINFEASYSVNKFEIQIPQIKPITENLEETAPILNSNMTNIGSEEAEIMPNLLISLKDKDDLFKNQLIENITNNGFNITSNETKRFGNNDYLLVEVNDTGTVLKLKDYLDMTNPNITSSLLRVFEPF